MCGSFVPASPAASAVLFQQPKVSQDYFLDLHPVKELEFQFLRFLSPFFWMCQTMDFEGGINSILQKSGWRSYCYPNLPPAIVKRMV